MLTTSACTNLVSSRTFVKRHERHSAKCTVFLLKKQLLGKECVSNEVPICLPNRANEVAEPVPGTARAVSAKRARY